jgi:hypothetical protein
VVSAPPVPLMAAAYACSVFISVRLSEDEDGAATTLKDALETARIPTFLCGDRARPGDDIAEGISRSLDACELFVVLGTEGFGKQGDTHFSTREELSFAMGCRKPIFLIKRCNEFEDPLTKMYLPAAMLYVEWPPRTPMPETLVDEIRDKLEALRAGGSVPQMCVC